MNDTKTVKYLPADITSYDLVKTFAVITMIVDHLGFYFFPENLWFRAVGRASFPVWFFLIGYANSREVPPKFIIGAFLLLLFDYITGLAVLPLNVLFTLMGIRLSIDFLMKPVMNGRLPIWSLGALLLLLAIPTYFASEYGTQGVIMAILGYLIRHRDRLKNPGIITEYAIFVVMSYVVVEKFIFNFDWSQLAFVLVWSGVTCAALCKFTPRAFPALSARMPLIIKAGVQFMGRRTLEIYVGHLILFKLIAVYIGDDRFEWFRLAWV